MVGTLALSCGGYWIQARETGLPRIRASRKLGGIVEVAGYPVRRPLPKVAATYLNPVVKVQAVSLAKGLPARSLAPLAPPLIVAVYFVDAPRFLEGSNVTVLPSELTVTAPVTGAVEPRKPTFAKVRFEVVSVCGFIASEKVTVTLALRATFFAPS